MQKKNCKEKIKLQNMRKIVWKIKVCCSFSFDKITFDCSNHGQEKFDDNNDDDNEQM